MLPCEPGQRHRATDRIDDRRVVPQGAPEPEPGDTDDRLFPVDRVTTLRFVAEREFVVGVLRAQGLVPFPGVRRHPVGPPG
jgi:hypothetical protein